MRIHTWEMRGHILYFLGRVSPFTRAYFARKAKRILKYVGAFSKCVVSIGKVACNLVDCVGHNCKNRISTGEMSSLNWQMLQLFLRKSECFLQVIMRYFGV